MRSSSAASRRHDTTGNDEPRPTSCAVRRPRRLGQEVNRRPWATSASTKFHGLWQIEATGLPDRTNVTLWVASAACPGSPSPRWTRQPSRPWRQTAGRERSGIGGVGSMDCLAMRNSPAGCKARRRSVDRLFDLLGVLVAFAPGELRISAQVRSVIDTPDLADQRSVTVRGLGEWVGVSPRWQCRRHPSLLYIELHQCNFYILNFTEA
jgi:hypothetical protein